MSIRPLGGALALNLDALVNAGALDAKWLPGLLQALERDLGDARLLERRDIANDLSVVAQRLKDNRPILDDEPEAHDYGPGPFRDRSGRPQSADEDRDPSGIDDGGPRSLTEGGTRAESMTGAPESSSEGRDPPETVRPAPNPSREPGTRPKSLRGRVPGGFLGPDPTGLP